MKKPLLFSLIVFSGISTGLYAQSLSLVQTNSTIARIPSLVHSKVIKLNGSGSPNYAAAITLATSGPLSYCNNSFYITERSQTLALFNNNLDVIYLQVPEFEDYYTNQPQPPRGMQYFKNSVAHDVTETRRGTLVVSGALETFAHDPHPNMGCGNSFTSSMLFLYNTDVTGNIKWAFGYDIPAVKSKVIELQSGKLVVLINDAQDNLYYLLLDSKGLPLLCRVFDNIVFNSALELKETSGNLLVVGNSTKYKSNQPSNRTDVVCLSFNTKNNLAGAISLGRDLADAAGSIQYNPYTGKYFLVINSEDRNHLTNASAGVDIIGFDCDDQLNLSNHIGWSSPESEYVFDVLIDSSDKNKAITLYGVLLEPNVYSGYIPRDFLLQESFDGSRQFSFFPVQSNYLQQSFAIHSGNPYSNTLQFYLDFPLVPTSLNLFKTTNNEYLMIRPNRSINPPFSASPFSAPSPTMMWIQTDLQLDRGYCKGEPFELKRFHPDISTQNINPIFTSRQVRAYRPSTNRTVVGTITETIDCGNKELLGPIELLRSNNKKTPEFPAVRKLAIFPNPASDRITIGIPTDIGTGLVEIRINDVMGRPVLSKKVGFTKDGKVVVSISSLATGSYFIQANSRGKVFSNKFIKLAP